MHGFDGRVRLEVPLRLAHHSPFLAFGAGEFRETEIAEVSELVLDSAQSVFDDFRPFLI